MTNEFIQNTIVAILENNIGISRKAITANASFYKDLGLDSLDVAELIMEIELSFGIDIPAMEAEKILTLKQAINYIKKVQ